MNQPQRQGHPGPPGTGQNPPNPPEPPNPEQVAQFAIFQECQRVIALLAAQERVALNTRFQKEVIAKLRGSGWELVIEDGTVFAQWPLNFGLPKNTENKKFIETKRETNENCR